MLIAIFLADKQFSQIRRSQVKKTILLAAVLVSIVVVASSCSQTQPTETSPLQEEGKFRVEVSRNGFDNTQGEFRLEVEEGQEVTITFVYGDGDFPQNNPHIIAIPDYGIDTGVLDENNLEVTLRFTASKDGEVSFICTEISCVGHPNLQGGIIVIQPGG